ncbi:unnamed protein product [Symbiodinium necroappetens]|uniref:Uncharacterized protein n=1 Tax=Symbiodinium necroappetens TaxID=1628268 RepID=A0A813BXQ4_9DINO|nr:unnamed protein product [Symbiodinium necroappetens]
MKAYAIQALRFREDEAVNSAGTNYNINGRGINYTYRYATDCYGNGNSYYKCPEGTWCQVEARPNWYPWDVSYMNRGRCLPYSKLNDACEPAFEGKVDYPMKEDGHYFERPVHCGPEDELICTGEETGCWSSEPFCAGRPDGECPEHAKAKTSGRPRTLPEDSFREGTDTSSVKSGRKIYVYWPRATGTRRTARKSTAHAMATASAANTCNVSTTCTASLARSTYLMWSTRNLRTAHTLSIARMHTAAA